MVRYSSVGVTAPVTVPVTGHIIPQKNAVVKTFELEIGDYLTLLGHCIPPAGVRFSIHHVEFLVQRKLRQQLARFDLNLLAGEFRPRLNAGTDCLVIRLSHGYTDLLVELWL
jgi:hypothetical protein